MCAQSHVPSTAFAVVHLGLGEPERALEWLENASRLHECSLTSINVHPIYNPLRGEPRFQELLRKMGFER